MRLIEVDIMEQVRHALFMLFARGESWGDNSVCLQVSLFDLLAHAVWLNSASTANLTYLPPSLTARQTTSKPASCRMSPMAL